ncbi:receptor-like protein EIX2 [Manihot esculenta]|uniref:Uncharacterized protein n=1 Tax=Manihot esculenta TaxID=3983 RepID=A0ACC8DCJ0_MANES|nr:receptor-like protein EIX2 [Manihot esculenta]OAY45382.2 hypothetical protein MANES_07G052600v8 [Manihot esculenta]
MTFLQLLAIFNGFLFMEINGYNLVDQEPEVQCKESEREALLGFKKGFRNHFSYFSSWKPEEDCCQWKRVECNHKTGHVIALNLRGNKENVSEQLQGEINRSLLHLPYLSFLDLSQNDFNQIQIPEFFGSLSSLNYLNLSNSKFKGTIPDQLGNLSSLHELDLSANGFSPKSNNLDWVRGLSSLRVLDLGEVDLSNACNWLEAINMLPFLRELRLFACKLHKLPESLPHVNFTSLEILDLSLNSFNCSIPSWLFKISHSLVELQLRRNQLHGLIPDAFGNMTSLVELDFSENNLQGHVPKSLAKLSRLIVLNFAWNSLEGTVSHVQLLNLSNLRVLELSSNQLAFNVSSNWIPTFQLEIVGLSCCHLGLQFPKWLRTQKSFSFIDISNSGISDIVPNWFWNLSPGVRCMNLSFNGLRGNVPDLSLKSELSIIDLTWNRFSGPVPLFSPKMRVVILSRNLFSGEISNLCEMMSENNSLSYLALSNNLLSGPIPDCWTRGQDLQVLNLASNNLSGEIPGSIGSLVQLKLLILENNSLHGEIPSALKSCTSLLVLHLGLNNLCGGVPEWIGEICLLMVLGLNSNALEGFIPLQLCQLKALKFLNLSSNHLSGQIPQCVDTLYAMTETGSGCSYTHGLSTLTNGTIKKTQLLFPLVFPIVKRLDLSSNNFSGEIPPQVMKLIGLVGLNLSRNRLTGTIPPNIGGMEALGSLDVCPGMNFHAPFQTAY